MPKSVLAKVTCFNNNYYGILSHSIIMIINFIQLQVSLCVVNTPTRLLLKAPQQGINQDLGLGMDQDQDRRFHTIDTNNNNHVAMHLRMYA